MTGAGSTWLNDGVEYNNTPTFTVGHLGGTGTLNVEDGGQVLLENTGTLGMMIGREPGSTGDVTITGAGSEINMDGRMDVGRGGIGTRADTLISTASTTLTWSPR